ncbi:hypothetical protein [Halalkalibaculum sp. DA384]|uniref:hypothetical protein n=1 Tax=Halalkalibaculum sp. DA384 TaxID=3373606 RepID=UPI0037550736
MRSSQRKRIEKLESRNQQPTAPPAVERVIYDSREQVENPERFNKVLIHETDNRKIFELERK